VGIALVLSAFVYLKITTKIEEKKIYNSAPNSTKAISSDLLDHAQLLSDVRTLSSAEYEGRRTGTTGNKKAQAFLLQRLDELKLQPLEGSFTRKFSFVHHSIKGIVSPSRKFKQDFSDATNLIASIAGVKEPSRYLVLSAHYDHLGTRDHVLYPGADDNASGVATVLACAKYFAGHRPERSILFIFFDAEELGLKGSESFFQHLPLKKERLLLDINLDMVSHNNQNQIFVAGTYHSPFLKPYAEQIQSTSKVHVLMGHDRPMARAGFVDDWTEASDHGPFHKAGIPFLYFGVEDHEDYHQPTDTFDHINQNFYVNVSETVLQTAILLDHRL
jgi:hypothetical protein